MSNKAMYVNDSANTVEVAPRLTRLKAPDMEFDHQFDRTDVLLLWCPR
jgi:hypothetical protein